MLLFLLERMSRQYIILTTKFNSFSCQKVPFNLKIILVPPFTFKIHRPIKSFDSSNHQPHLREFFTFSPISAANNDYPRYITGPTKRPPHFKHSIAAGRSHDLVLYFTWTSRIFLKNKTFGMQLEILTDNLSCSFCLCCCTSSWNSSYP
jgi:hypothetical protein